MSEGEIIFGELTYREPARLRPPDREGNCAAIAYGKPNADDMPIYIDQATADMIERHALSDTSVELGGILLGKECLDPDTGRPFVRITRALEAKHYQNTQASFTYTHDSWEEINRERDLRCPDLDIVGWYHTHPDFGIFLSGHDEFIHRHFFNQPLHVAYVVDPIRQDRGFFRWSEGRLVPLGGYFITADRKNRVALARFVNELENLPASSDGAGGLSLSPRLEAELIAMLSRPHAAPAGIDRAQSAATFGLVGAIAGAFVLSALLWLFNMGLTVQAQSKTIEKLEADLIAAIEILTRREGLEKPESIVSTINELEKEKASSSQELKTAKASLTAVTEKLESLRKELDAKTKSLSEADSKLAALKAEASSAAGASGSNALESSPPDKTQYRFALGTAIAGWSIALILGYWLFSIQGKIGSLSGKPHDPQT